MRIGKRAMAGNVTTLKPITTGDPRGGRKVGQTNLLTRVMKRALVLAAENSEHSDGSLVGYVTWIANVHPQLFCNMLGRLVPLEARVQTNGPPLQRLTPDMDLPTMISEFERKIQDPTYFATPHNTIEHSVDDDDEFEQ
jgi:hypothetical protein